MNRILFYFRFISSVIIKNPGKLIALSICLICVYFPNWGGEEHQAPIISNIAVGNESNGYSHLIIYNDDGTYRLKHSSNPIIKENKLHYTEQSELLIFALLGGVIGGLVFLLGPLESEGRWDFEKCKYDAWMKEVKLDKDNTSNYYYFRGKLIVSYERDDYYGDSIPTGDIKDGLKEYNKTPNLFESYDGDERKRRDSKLKDLISSK